MLVDDMDIPRLMDFSQQIENLKHEKEKKRIKMDNNRTDGHGRSKNQLKFF